MGCILVEITVENSGDLVLQDRGLAPEGSLRTAVIPNALVDTGATLLSLPSSVIQQLGLRAVSLERVTSSTGPAQARLYEAVRLTIQGRQCTMDVLEVPDGVPALVGQIPLEHLDFVVDMKGHRLIGNPAHNGEHVYEMY